MHVGFGLAASLQRALLLLLLAAAFTTNPRQLQAAIYRWVDASGREHFTTNLDQVPPQHRAAAKAAEKRSHSRMNVVDGDSSSSGGAARSHPTRPPGTLSSDGAPSTGGV